jgi:hypothetical protein
MKTALDYDLTLLAESIDDASPDDWMPVDAHYEELFLEEVVPHDIECPNRQLDMAAAYFDYDLTGDYDRDWSHIQEQADLLAEDITVMLAEFGYDDGVLAFYGENDEDGAIPGSPYCLWMVRSVEPLVGEEDYYKQHSTVKEDREQGTAASTIKKAQEGFSLRNYAPSDEELEAIARMMVVGIAASLVQQGLVDKKALAGLKPADASALLPNLAKAIAQQREAFKNEIVVLKRYGAEDYLARRARDIKGLA